MNRMSIAEEILQSFKKGGTLVKIIYINLAVYILYNLLFVFFYLSNAAHLFNLSAYLAVPAYLPSLFLRPWTLVTYMFFHEGFLHILFNLLWLYWFGVIFLQYMSQRLLLGVYIMSGLTGAFLYILFYNTFPVFSGVLPASYALGASAGVLGVVIAISTYTPNLSLNLLFIGPVRLKYIALFTVVLDIISIAGSNSGGHIAHLGGALMGFLFARGYKKGYNLVKPITFLANAFSNVNIFSRKPKMRVNYKRPLTDMEYNQIRNEKQKEIDRILDKISKSGYDSLSAEEKKTLFNMKSNL